MVEWLQFTLRVWDQRGQEIAAADFIERLTIAPGDPVGIEDGRKEVPRIRLLTVGMADFAKVDTAEDAGAQTEAFAKSVREGLQLAAKWLVRQEPNVFAALRAAGRITDLSVSGWMTDDQFDLDLPPEFLLACGKLGLTISVCTND